MSAYHPDTICAVATAPGRSSVGILRVSGPDSRDIAKKIIRSAAITPRYAHYSEFFANGSAIDQGIALFFQSPHSFTGEDVLELQCHGGPIVLDMLLREVIALGARPAKPGEFSQRAFLNDKMDLTQAEAISDLIEATSEQAAKNAINTLKGEFSKKIEGVVDKLIQTRIYVESAIDFPEEEVDFLSDGKISLMLDEIVDLLERTLSQANQGALLREGINVVIAGRPNAGKSSLLNRLAEQDLAIVTDIAGTTRDLLKQQIHIDGLPLHIIDTAGLRESPDLVERIGISRAWQEIDNADHILLIIDSSDQKQLGVEEEWPEFFSNAKYQEKLTIIYNKVDLSHYKKGQTTVDFYEVCLSALSGEGIEDLKARLKEVAGYQAHVEGHFSARRRHLSALDKAKDAVTQGRCQFNNTGAGELLALDLHNAQEYLSEITGAFTADDLLGEIFSSFCIGK